MANIMPPYRLHFTEYGYKTLIIWERELKNKNKVRNKILTFNEV